MLTKLNIFGIVIDHLNTLGTYRGRRYKGVEIFIFYGLPFLLSLALLWFGFSLNDNTANILLTSLSIFAGLLLNLLLMIFDAIRKTKDDKDDPERETLLKETYSNIAYCILIALTCTLILMGFAIWDISYNPGWVSILKAFVSALVYFLVFNFSLTLFMVLKRIHSLLSHEFV